MTIGILAVIIIMVAAAMYMIGYKRGTESARAMYVRSLKNLKDNYAHIMKEFRYEDITDTQSLPNAKSGRRTV